MLPLLLGGVRVRRWHGLSEELALAFAMGTHARLGASVGVTGRGGLGFRSEVEAGAGQGPGGGRGLQGMPVLYDARGSGETGGGGVQVGGQGGRRWASGRELMGAGRERRWT